MKRTVFLSLLTGVIFLSGNAEAMLYKWVSPDGTINFSDKPPPGVKPAPAKPAAATPTPPPAPAPAAPAAASTPTPPPPPKASAASTPTPPPPPSKGLPQVLASSFTFTDKPVGPVSKRFFGVHIHYADKLAKWPSTVPIGSWRTWDSGTTWEHLQGSPVKRATWDFSKLDIMVNDAVEHDVEMLYTFGVTPTWASARPKERFVYGFGAAAEPHTLADFSAYVTNVASRYVGKIKYYEIWNEPTFTDIPGGGKGYFTGSKAALIQMTAAAHKALSAVDPTDQLLSPGFTGDLGRMKLYMLDPVAQKSHSVVAFHAYANPPEDLFDYYKRQVTWVRNFTETVANGGAANGPLKPATKGSWMTEFAYTTNNTGAYNGWQEVVANTDEVGIRTARYLLIAASLGIERVFYHRFDRPEAGMIGQDGNPTRPGQAWIQMARWMKDATIDGCKTNDNVTFACKLERTGRVAWVVWQVNDTAGTKGVNTAASFVSPDAVEYETIYTPGVTHLSAKGSGVPIGRYPVLVKTDTSAWGADWAR